MVIVSKIAKDTKFRQLHIRCPVCRARLCDTILENHQAKIITSEKESSLDLLIKCHKCGLLVGLKIKSNIT